MKLVLIFIIFVIPTVGRVLDRNYYHGSVSGKVFDYYDVAKGNVPTYMTFSDKFPEAFVEDTEPLKISNLDAKNNEIQNEEQIEVVPAAETSENYYEYPQEDLSKPLGTVVDSETNEEKKNSTEIISKVDDEMTLVTIKPLCDD